MSNVKDLEQLQTIFKSRLSDSRDPATLILREIKYIENVLDIYAPRVPFSYGDLFAVRKAYEKHIVSGLKLMERYAPAKQGDKIALWSTGPSKPTEDPYEFDFSKARKFKLVPPHEHEVDALNLATALFEYLQWLRTLGQPSTSDLIVRRGCLELIWDKHKDYFKGETPESWVKRFTHPDINLPMPPIEVESAAKEGSGRLILIAILASIQKATGNAFDFADYVRTHFGIEGFESAKTRNKSKNTYQATTRYCDGILNK